MEELNLGLKYRGVFEDWYWFYASSDMREKFFVNMDHPVWKEVTTPTIYDFDEVYHFKASKKEKRQFQLGFEGYYYNKGDEVKEFSRTGKGNYLSSLSQNVPTISEEQKEAYSEAYLSMSSIKRTLLGQNKDFNSIYMTIKFPHTNFLEIGIKDSKNWEENFRLIIRALSSLGKLSKEQLINLQKDFSFINTEFKPQIEFSPK